MSDRDTATIDDGAPRGLGFVLACCIGVSAVVVVIVTMGLIGHVFHRGH
jgi:hypothetical protein